MLTEDEARGKWCPMARIVTYDKYANEFPAGVAVGMTAANKTSDGEIRRNAYCIASDCMAWRWSEKQPRETIRLYKDQTEVEGIPVIRAGNLRTIKGELWHYEHSDVDARGEFEYLHRACPENSASQRGYCGAFGRPE